MKKLKSISLLLLLVPACAQDTVEGSNGGTTSGNGGASSSGITSHTGGITGSGGTHGAGGKANVGGASNAAGMSNLGGNSNASGATSTSEMSHSGGANSLGGASSAGGLASTGGVNGAATGGKNPAGGTAAAGGVPATGGAIAASGANATGGRAAIGGATATGGAIGTGGALPTGGAAATGGTDAGIDAGCAQAPVDLGAADDFVVLAGSTVTSTGPTSVTGDLGVSPGTAVTGFGPGTIVGSQHVNDPTAAQGEADLTTAYNDAAGRTLCAVTVSGNLGGQTLTPGLYRSTSSLEISSGDLTLDAQGNPDAVFIFQMASTLTTTSGRQIILSGSAKSTNVFWQVGTSATLGSTSVLQGTVMADQAITMDTGATLNGRVLARVAAVALDTNTIVKPSL
jgi:hypothetical protein